MTCDELFETEEFIDAMQRYRCAPRHDPAEVWHAFEAVKRLIKDREQGCMMTTLQLVQRVITTVEQLRGPEKYPALTDLREVEERLRDAGFERIQGSRIAIPRSERT